MWRFLGVAVMFLSATAGWADDMERLAARVAEDIRGNLQAVEVKVAYIGMNGSRAYLAGDLSSVRPGQDVVFFRDGAAVFSPDSPPAVLGRESLEIGRGRISAIHDRTAWVSIDTTSRVQPERGDWALVRLDAPMLRVIPFFMDDGSGAPKLDGRGRILRSLILYNLKRQGMQTTEISLDPAEVDAVGLPVPAALNEMTGAGVLMIGRLLSRQDGTGDLVVGIALYDLSVKEMRFARSYSTRTLEAFSPMVVGGEPARAAAAQTAAFKVETPAPAPIPPRAPPANSLEGVLRLFVPSALKLEWPPKTPADAAVLELVAASLPEIALEWMEDPPGTLRITLPSRASSHLGVSVSAKKISELLSTRRDHPAVLALLGPARWKAESDSVLILTLDTPVSDLRDRLAFPEFRLAADDFESIGDALGPYRIASRGARTTILEKRPALLWNEIWSEAPDTIILTTERDPKKRAKGFEEGQVDIHELLDEEILKYSNSQDARVSATQPDELIVLAINGRKVPGDSIRFRRMLAMSLNRRGALEVALGQRIQPALEYIPPSAKNIPPALVKIPEKNMAGALLISRDRPDTTKITLIYPVEESFYGVIAESLKSDFSGLKLSIDLQGISWRAYADRLADGDYDLAVVSIRPAAPYRLWLQQTFGTNGKENRWGYRNTIVDALVTESGDLGAAQDLIHSDLPVIPLFWMSRQMAFGKRVAEAWPGSGAQKFFSSIRLK